MPKLWVTITCAVGALITALLIGFPKSPVVIPPTNPHDAERLPHGTKKSVLIIGGGVAGLSAAFELAERGYDVTIREASSHLGGRIKTTQVEKLGRSFHVDTGHLGVFHNYHQFHDIQERLGVQHHFYPVDATDIEFRDYQREHIYTWEPWPLNIMGLIMRSPNLSILQSMYWIHAGFDFVNFDYTKVYQKFGHMNFDDYDKARNLHPPFAAIILRPALAMTFNDPKKFSAAEFLLYSHFFSISNPKANRKDMAVHNSQDAILDAWVNKLKSLGVRIELNSQAEGLVLDSQTNRVTAESSHPDEVYDHTIIATDIPGVKHIFQNTISSISPNTDIYKILTNISDRTISKVTLAPPYKLLWVWFDKQLDDTNTPVMLQTPEFSPLSCITQLHLLQEEFIQWANETGGSVFLFDLYVWNSGNIDDAKLWQFISPIVNDIYPEISDRKFKVLDFHVDTGTTHPAYLKDVEKYRPRATLANELGIPNLSFAGDWLHTDYPSVFMERAVFLLGEKQPIRCCYQIM
ncbi:carotenoid phi-ring synthase-like [Amphiura filiformis]|uniref:carotenoid phi-ring synthase-like n=1 Tax=Amphiura filiformis TaxID=82378 RepID=UPI003B2139F6